MAPLTRLRDIQLSFLHINPLSDVSILDALMSFAYVRRYASFPLASHFAVSSEGKVVVEGHPSTTPSELCVRLSPHTALPLNVTVDALGHDNHFYFIPYS